MNRVPVNRILDPETEGGSKYGIFPRTKEERLEKTLTQLLSKISRTTGETKVNYLHTLWNMITPNNDLMKTFICLPHFQVLPFLSTLLTDEQDINILHPIIGCLWYLSRNEPISLQICSKEIPLLSNIMRILSLFPVFKEDILKIIGNCALVKETHSHLLYNDYHLLEYLKNNILNDNHNHNNDNNDNNEELSYQVLTCFTSSLTIQECDNMIQYNLPSLIFQHFFLLLELQSYSTMNSNIVYWCLNYLTLLSYTSNRGIQHLLLSMNNRSENRFMIQFLIKFLDQENMTSLKVAIILASIFGKHSLQYEETYYHPQQHDEPKSEQNEEHVKREIEQELKQKSLKFGFFSSPRNNNHIHPSFCPQTFLRQYPYLYPLLLQVYDITLNYHERESLYIQLSKKGFGYGVVKLRNITDTLRNLSYYDDNQRIMILMNDKIDKKDKKDRINEESFDLLFSLLLQTIVLYINNSSECSGMGSGTGAGIKEYGGGGGNDIDTLENVLELLVQLSIGSYYEILYHYISSNSNSNNHKYHLITLLNQLIHLPERRLTIEMKEYSQLLYHLYTR